MPAAFPGYYTLHVLGDGKVTGMLSVNAATGAVWSHWWHGRFVSMLEAGAGRIFECFYRVDSRRILTARE